MTPPTPTIVPVISMRRPVICEPWRPERSVSWFEPRSTLPLIRSLDVVSPVALEAVTNMVSSATVIGPRYSAVRPATPNEPLIEPAKAELSVLPLPLTVMGFAMID